MSENDQNVEIEGIIITKINKFSDNRGWLAELFRDDETGFKPKMSYISHTNNGVARGPHEHEKQSDFFVFVGYGDFELYLWDNRKGSNTFGNHIKIVVGESNNVSVIIPPGVVHGYKSISEKGSLSINLPDKLYAGEGKKEKVDEIRHEDDVGSRFRIDQS